MARKPAKAVAAPPRAGFSGKDNSVVYLAHATKLGSKGGTVNFDDLRTKVAPEFAGAHLSVLHTPTDWQPTDVFNLVMALRGMNRKADLDTYLVLVGCGLVNVHMFREALYRQTKHVHFVVFDCDSQDQVRIGQGKPYIMHLKFAKLLSILESCVIPFSAQGKCMDHCVPSFFQGCLEAPHKSIVILSSSYKHGTLPTQFVETAIISIVVQLRHLFGE